MPGDLTSPDDVRRVAAQATEDGSIDVLVNNAGGISLDATDTLEQIEDRWTSDFLSNVRSAVLLTEALLPHLTGPGGRIVVMSSIAGVRRPGSYGAAEAGFTTGQILQVNGGAVLGRG